jgi:hypothetical protein
MTRLIAALALVSFSYVTYAAPPITEPVKVTVTNSPLTVTGAPPEFVRLETTVFSRNPFDNNRTKVLQITQHVVIHDVHVFTTGIREVAGCMTEISRRRVGEPNVTMFRVYHADLDTSTIRANVESQQRLGDGIELNSGDEIVVSGLQTTDPETPQAGPNAFCSTAVQLFGTAIP